jgi:hypothetical protein
MTCKAILQITILNDVKITNELVNYNGFDTFAWDAILCDIKEHIVDIFHNNKVDIESSSENINITFCNVENYLYDHIHVYDNNNDNNNKDEYLIEPPSNKQGFVKVLFKLKTNEYYERLIYRHWKSLLNPLPEVLVYNNKCIICDYDITFGLELCDYCIYDKKQLSQSRLNVLRCKRKKELLKECKKYKEYLSRSSNNMFSSKEMNDYKYESELVVNDLDCLKKNIKIMYKLEFANKTKSHKQLIASSVG